MSVTRHSSYNLAGMLLPVALSLATVPLYIEAIGEARYGVLAIAWLLLGYFGVFDLGLGAAAAQRIASLEKGSRQQRAEVFWAALVSNAVLGIVGGLLLWPIATYVAGHVIAMDPQLRAELLAAVPWLAFGVPVATISGVLTGALQGRREFLELNIIAALGSTLVQLAPLAFALIHGPDLLWLIAAVLGPRLLTMVLLFWRCRKHLPSDGPVRLTSALVTSLLRFGGWVTVSTIIAPLLSVLDRFAIGSTIGAQAVTHYTVPLQLAERMVMLPNAVCTALFPKFASVPETERRSLIGSTVAFLSSVLTPVTVGGVLLIDPFLSLWISPQFASAAAPSAKVLLLGFWIVSMSYVPFAELRGSGRPQVIAKCHVGELLPYLALLYLGLTFGGLTGAALAFLVRALFDCALLMHFAGVARNVLPKLALYFLLPVGAYAMTQMVPTGSGFWFVGGLALGLASLAVSWITLPETFRLKLVKHIPIRE